MCREQSWIGSWGWEQYSPQDLNPVVKQVPVQVYGGCMQLILQRAHVPV